MKNRLQALNNTVGPKSPLPFILQLRNWIFGKVAPTLFIKLGFYFMTLVGFVFFFWNVMSSFALSMRYVVRENRNISVKDFLYERAIELEIHPDYILPKLLTFFSVSAICWLVFLFGMVLFWRQKKMFYLVSLSSVIFYLGMALFYVGGLFFWEEFTGVDKILLFVILAMLTVYRFFFWERVDK